jgi:hypothetical protein
MMDLSSLGAANAAWSEVLRLTIAVALARGVVDLPLDEGELIGVEIHVGSDPRIIGGWTSNHEGIGEVLDDILAVTAPEIRKLIIAAVGNGSLKFPWFHLGERIAPIEEESAHFKLEAEGRLLSIMVGIGIPADRARVLIERIAP